MGLQTKLLFLLNLNVVLTFGEYGSETFACYALDPAGDWMNVWGTV